MTNRMSKITFRADDHLIEQLEEFDASKSEVMREALREFLDEPTETRLRSSATDGGTVADADSIDALIVDRVDAIVDDRLEEAFTPASPQDVNVNITLDGDSVSQQPSTGETSHAQSGEASHTRGSRKTDPDASENADEGDRKTCSQCGENIVPGHVYCPNCGEKASHRVFCECGDELRSDWAFCPSCGRRTPAADVLDGA
jgi:Arc/MetJ-type ribon-helix-helix transcriptional regulator/predicted RNA-binding Zn-ribbon protein involved in translation (DUF1610 family)